jgi:hypothetical protein
MHTLGNRDLCSNRLLSIGPPKHHGGGGPEAVDGATTTCGTENAFCVGFQLNQGSGQTGGVGFGVVECRQKNESWSMSNNGFTRADF